MRKNGKRALSAPKVIAITLILAILIAAFLAWQNNDIVVSRHVYESAGVPDSFDGFVIAQVSDLHNKVFYGEQSSLMEKLRAAKPDVIVITGDLIDSRAPDINVAVDFVARAAQIAPVYYVKGNHEARLPDVDEIMAKLSDAGAIVLADERAVIICGEDEIAIVGLDASVGGALSARLYPLMTDDTDELNILLAHEPQYIDEYAASGADIVFSGHAHGGQIRLPFIGGLYAPGQGIFPKYTSGRYDVGGAAMYVSRGLGGKEFPFRIMNRPEIVVVELKGQGNRTHTP